MSDGIIKLASTGIPAQDIAVDLVEKIKTLIYDECRQRTTPFALVIGVLEVVKLEIAQEQKN